MALSSFAGENFLTQPLPDYVTEWKTILFKAIIATIVFIVVLPKVVQSWFCSGFTPPSHESSTTKTSREDESFSMPNESRPNHKIRVVTKTTINGIEGRSFISRKDNNNNIVSSRNRSIQKVCNEAPNHHHGHATNDDEKKNTNKVPNFVFPFINAVYLAYLFFLILQSPNNKDTARMVYMAPLLKQHETDMIIQMATNAAERNARKAKEELDRLSKDHGKSSSNQVKRLEKLLEWPAGFLKDRHATYPTTDLNVVIDFEEEDKSTIGQILDARLGPLLERIYGVSKDSLRTNDMFVVRYDGEGQQSLGMHTDSCHISFNVLLNDDFEGGGTRFHNLKDDSHQDANPKPGNVLINNAMVLHEGLPTTKGTRYILVGFLYVDVKDPWSGVKKHVSWFSTYLSIPWLTVVLKEALEIKSQPQAAAASRSNRDERNHQGSKDALILSLINEAFWSFYAMGNSLAHDIVSLVREEDADAYIDTLDSSHKNVHGDESHRGVRWFSGQQIHLNWDGSIYSEWQARMDNQEKFHGSD